MSYIHQESDLEAVERSVLRGSAGASRARIDAVAVPPYTSEAVQKPRILVVEDEADVRAMTARVLAAFAEVSTAADGASAVAQLQVPGASPDLIITDVMMPGMDGLELVRWLKQHPQLGRIPVVMLTAKTRPADMIEGINAGARSYLTKPFKPDELVARVKKLLGLPK